MKKGQCIICKKHRKESKIAEKHAKITDEFFDYLKELNKTNFFELLRDEINKEKIKQ
jgi:hypothetical protein